MRLHINFTPNTTSVPFDYQHLLIRTFHKWMGWNDIHDEISLYSLSWLNGGRVYNNALDFDKGARWFISFWDNKIGTQLLAGIRSEPETFCGMAVNEVVIKEDPTFREVERFTLASPALVRKYDEGGKANHLTYKDNEFDNLLTKTMQHKLKMASLDYDIKVRRDNLYSKPKTKLVNINGIKSRANYCPVIIEGNPEAIAFAWNVGIGHSTGCCFGSLN